MSLVSQYQPVAKTNGAGHPAGYELAVTSIRVDGGTQSRAILQDSVIEEYALALAEGVSFPSIIVFYDGTDHWLADGFHRYQAHVKLGLVEISADIRQGTRRDAILYSVGANEAHGLRRTNEDKRRAVLTLLNDGEWVKWSDREIGRQCRVDHKFVAKHRPVTGDVPSERTYTTKHGSVATMNTSAIGKSTNNTTDGEMEETNAQTSEVKKNSWVKFSVPEGQDVTSLIRLGMQIERDGAAASADQIGPKVGLSKHVYRLGRIIVHLSDNTSLTKADADIVRSSMKMLTQDQQIGPAWELVEPLAKRVFGSNKYWNNLLGLAEKRLSAFERSFGIVVQSCVTTDEIEVPYLSAEDAKKTIQQIGKARGALARFADRIKEIHK